jgi:hypothetical protein
MGKMGGGMMKRYSKGGGADSGRVGEMKSRVTVGADRIRRMRKKLKDLVGRGTPKPVAKMGGGVAEAARRVRASEMKKGGLKAVDKEKNPGLAKLPTRVRNKMGYMKRGGKANTRRMNRLEELGRVDAEKARTKKGARNLRSEKRRIVRELKK